jgi:signal transduction histidine kinase
MHSPEVDYGSGPDNVGAAILEDRLQALYEISEGLSRSITREEIATIVTARVIRIFGASMGGLLELTNDGREAVLIGSAGFPEGVVAEFQRFPADAPFPLRDAVSTRSPVVIRDLAEWNARYSPSPILDAGTRAVLPLVVDDRVNGCITLTFQDSRDFSEDDLDFMMAVAHQCGLALERARLFDDHRQQVAVLAKLHAISDSLSSALTKEEVAFVIDKHLKETLGAVITGVLRLSDDGNHFVLLHANDWNRDHREQLQHFPVDASLPVRDAVKLKQPIFLRDVRDWLERGYADPPGGFIGRPDAARVALPLLIGHRAIGVLSLTYSAPHDFTQADRNFLLAVATQCAQAMERARLYDLEHATRVAAERTARRIAQLQRSAGALATAITRQDVAKCVVEQVREALLPVAAAVLELSEDGRELRLLVADGTTDAVRAQFSAFSIDTPVPATEVVKTRRAVFIGSRAEWGQRYSMKGIEDLGRNASATIPLLVDNRPVGVLTLTFMEERDFPLEEREFLHGFADQCAVALERARLYDAAETARGKAEHANAAKSQFLGIMSHELRTPLNAVIGYADLLLMEVRGTLTTEQRIQVERIRSSAWHQLTLIEEILTYARIEAGKEEARVSRINISEIIADTVELLRPDAHRKKLALQVSVETTDLILDTDPAKVRQIMLNLAGNAVKFTTQGIVEIGARREQNAVVCWVRDTGPGIPADKINLIWQPFTQVDQSDTRREGGTGLGLTIALRLALLLGGSLEVQSEFGKGTVFELRLPSALV